MDHRAALRYLDEHVNREASSSIAAGRTEGLTLEPMRRLLHALGDPHRSFPSVHITGTNGKGSVGVMVERLLGEHGLKVGACSSPHLQTVNERIRWAGEPIDDASFARVIGDVATAEVVAGVRPSYFEILTAAAFSWFAELPVDVAVVEVGLLGAFDATNVIDAVVAVVTNIGHDHTDFRPGWRQAISREKAGIVKPGSFLVLGETDPDLLGIFRQAASDQLWVRDDDFGVEADRIAVGGHLIDIRTPGDVLEEVFVPVHGAHQADNAAIAVAATEAFFARPLDAELARRAFAQVRLPGRFQIVRRSPLVVVDGAHNPEGAAALADTLDEEFSGIGGRRIIVLGLLTGRDPDAMLDALDARSADLVICTTPPSPRALEAGDLAVVVRRRGVAAEAVAEVGSAIDRALSVASSDDVVVIAGSLYVAGRALTVLSDATGRL